MEMGDMIRLCVELGDANLPVPRLRRAFRHIGIVNAYFAVAAFDDAGGSPTAAAALLAALALLPFAVAMVLLSVSDDALLRVGRRLARAVARASLAACAAGGNDDVGFQDKTYYCLRSYRCGSAGNVSCLYEYDGSRLVTCFA